MLMLTLIRSLMNMHISFDNQSLVLLTPFAKLNPPKFMEFLCDKQIFAY